jgi:hypothetical protein
MQKAFLAMVLAIAFIGGCSGKGNLQRNNEGSSVAVESGDDILASAFSERRSHVVVEGRGTVARILPDDNDGSRHQRFVLRVGTGATLLVSHNIDIAPRVKGLAVGDTVTFKGEYEWNEQGGVMHWTHHDPAGRHEAGWIRHNGQTYQ